MNNPKAASVFFTAVLLQLAPAALAQTGVGDDRVSLPDGPGSRDGLGDNASVNPNMGQMSTSVAIAVPGGFAGVTPSVALSYSSGAGNSVVGLGWSMSVPFIERMTSRGYPEYDNDDRFVAGGSDQLVRVSARLAEPAVYRARFEGGFVRYKWFERGTGGEGYWTAEYPDGTVATFGAAANGDFIPEARVGTDDGTFRYLITSMVDRFGHEMRYDYQVYGTTSLLDQISYVFTTGAPRYRVSFEYEQRDDIQSDARGGFLEEIADRLTFIDVFSGNTRISRYALDYEEYAAAGGASRLQRVRRFGKDGGLFPVVQSFEYSKALGGVCDDNSDARNCQAPYLVDMDELGVSIQSRTANLIDLNGDSLPDIVDTATPGAPMRIFLNSLNTDGTQGFIEKAGGSAVLRNVSGFELNSSKVQMLDVDGDGFVDLVNQQLGRVLKNKGAGDWDSVESVAPVVEGSSGDFGDFNASQDGDLSNVRFIDANGDRRIDVLRTSPARTEIFLNDGNGGYQILAGVELMGDDGFGNGWDFATTENLELADMNGDGLLDPVRILSGRLDYQLNLGFGRWSPIQSVTGLPFTVENDAQEVGVLELEDINGDGLDDVVVVLGSTVRFAINRNGATFDAVTTIEGVGNQSLPARVDTTTVLYADMNGNGSNDIVWITASGGVTFLELFPVRPNLLTKIENGLGLVTEVTYGTAAEQRANATDPATQWPDPIPTQMLVVTSMETYAQSSDPTAVAHQITRYEYQAGFYDGVEKLFRGFSRVAMTEDGDDHQQSAHTVMTYDTGAGEDRAQMAGLLLQETVDDDDGPQSDAASSFTLCPVDDILSSGLDFPIRFVCKTSEEVIHQEGAPASQWVTTRAEYEYDGYGNQTKSSNLGVTKIGDGGCADCKRDASVFGAPCGEQCLGDEAYDETDFIAPQKVAGAWMLNLQAEARSYGRPGSDVISKTRTFYDGAAFAGFDHDENDAVQATNGLVTRIAVQRVVGGPFEDIVRNQHDEDGNVIDTLGGRGAVDGQAFHTLLDYDSDHLDVIAETKGNASAAGEYSLKRVYEYDPLFGDVSRATAWFIVGEPPAEDTSESWSYDQFGRLDKNAAAGDQLAAPSSSYSYEYGNPVSRIVTRRSITSGGPLDTETIECMDGFGRALQSASKVADDSYLVSGAQRLNRNGVPTQIFEDFLTDAAHVCDVPGPSVVFDDIFYDSAGRERRVTRGDAALHGGLASRVERQFLPLVASMLDEDDTDADSPSRDTPVVQRTDGLGRVVAVERQLDPSGTSQVYTVTYDELGNVRGFTDSAGNDKVQTWDLSGRMLRLVDADRGTTTFEYDADSNVVRIVDANGTVTAREYDALERVTAEYDESDVEGTRTEYSFDRDPVCLPATCTNGPGHLVGVRYPLGELGEGTDFFGYDARERITFVARRLGDATFEFSTAWDNADRPVLRTYPGNLQLEYRYDLASRLVQIPGYIDSVTYDQRGSLADVHHANGTTTSRRYDVIGDLVRLETQTDDGDALLALDFTLSRQHDVRTISDVSSAAPGRLDAVYGYDALRRLTTAGVGPQGGATFEQQAYAYDLLDNLTTKTSSRGAASSEHVGALSYGPEHPRAVTTAGALALDYDPAGRMIARGSHAFAYDYRGRLRTVSQGDAVVGRAFYGASQRRVLSLVGGRRTYELAPALDVQDGVVRLRFGAGAHATVEVQSDAAMGELFPSAAADGDINAADGFAAGSASGGDDANAVLAASARRLLLGPDGRQTSWRVLDQLGSTIAVADANGAVTERIDYQPLGAVRASTAGRTEFASFTGRDFDDATGFLDLEARLFSPTEGRFLTPDDAFAGFTADQLLQLTDAAGVYSYCGGNPVSFVDSTGNQLESATYYARHAHREWAYRGGSAAKAVGYFSLMLIVQGRDAVRSAREEARSFIQVASGLLSSVVPKASEATARRENTRQVSLSDKGVDPVASSSSAASSELSFGQRVKGLNDRTEARLSAFIRTGANLSIEQKVRAHIQAKNAAKQRVALQKAVQAQLSKVNKAPAVKKGAAPGRARR